MLRIPVYFPAALPPGWSWECGDPYTGRAFREGSLRIRRYKAGGGVVLGQWQVVRAGRVVTGGHETPMAAALASEAEAHAAGDNPLESLRAFFAKLDAEAEVWGEDLPRLRKRYQAECGQPSVTIKED